MIAVHPRGFRFLFILVAIISATGCARLRNLPEGEAFLRKNKLKVHHKAKEHTIPMPFGIKPIKFNLHPKPKEYNISKGEIRSLAKPEPNRKILGLRFN